METFNGRVEIPGYSRMVSLDEIADPANDYNLNIPRYIDSAEPEDLHDLNAHLNGGIPDRDIDALAEYWEVFPELRRELFESNGRPGYSESRVESAQVGAAILNHEDFRVYSARCASVFEQWREASEPLLLGVGQTFNPKAIIGVLSEDTLARFAPIPLIDEYDLYQRLMDYWNDIMQDDVYLIASEGWTAGRELRSPTPGESVDFTVGTGRNSVKYVSDLIPPSLVIARFFAVERRELERLEAEAARTEGMKEELEETHAAEGGALDGLEGTKGITKTNVQQRVGELKDMILNSYPESAPEYGLAKSIAKTTFGKREWKQGVGDEDGLFAELDVLYDWLRADAALSELRGAFRTKSNVLYEEVRAKYAALTKDEIKALVIGDKWFADIRVAADGEVKRVTRRLATRTQAVEDRYAYPMPDLERAVSEFGSRVGRHIREMGVAYYYE